MIPAYEKAQYPWILISDSGLMMHEDTLYDMAICMADDVGLVHQMPFTCDRKGFAGSVEKVRKKNLNFSAILTLIQRRRREQAFVFFVVVARFD